MLCFCYSKLYHSVWQSLGPSIFCSLFLLLSVSVLFPLFPFLLHLRKSQAPSRPQSLGQLHHHACTAAASMNLSLPFSPPSVPPVCFLTWPSVLLQQRLCTWSPPSLEVSSSSGCMICSFILRCLRVSQGRFPQTLENSYQSILPPSFPQGPLSSPPASSSPRAPLPVGSLALTPSWVMKGCRRARAVLCAAAPQD